MRIKSLLLILLFLVSAISIGQVEKKGLPVYYKGIPVQKLGTGFIAPVPTCSDGIQNGDETGIDCGGSCGACPSNPPVADFVVNNTNPITLEGVTFTDTSTNTPTSWAWVFDGGTPATSTDQNPNVSYSSPGVYTVTLTATNADGSDGETKVNYITVTNGTPAVTIVATDPVATEAGTTTGQFTVTLSIASTGTTTINYNVSGTATSGSDYTALSGSVAITDGNMTGLITVTPIEDVQNEPSETVIVTLSSGTGYVIGSPNNATVTIQDNDPITGGNPDFFAANPSVSEPADGSTYVPTSSADISNVANAGRTAIISSSFSCTSCTFAAGQKIRPAGGVISGTNINLNGAYIDDVADQAFSSSATFTSIYQDSWVYAEVFGAGANDATDDSSAITALMNNVEFGRFVASGTYIKNTPAFVDRTGEFILDMNGGKLDVTSDAAYNESVDQQAVIWSFELNLKIYNGEVDLNGIYPAFVRMGGQEAFHFENLWVHDVQNDGVNMRTIAFNISLDTSDGTNSWIGGNPFGTYNTTQVFQSGYVKDCTIEQLNALGTGVPNGVAQAFWYQVDDIAQANSATVFHTGNVIRNVTGDESEGLYWDDGTFGGGAMVRDHLTTLEMQSDSIYNCGDRAMKATNGNLILNNNYFGTIDAAVGTPSGGAVVSIFTQLNSTYPTHRVTGVTITNNHFNDPNTTSRAQLLNVGDVDGLTVTGNTFEFNATGNYGGVNIGTYNTSGGLGAIENATFSGNTYINAGVEILNTITPSNMLFNNETFNWTYTGAGGSSNQGIFRTISTTGSMDGGTFTNLTANVIISSNGGSFSGWVISRGKDFINTTWDNVDMNYTTEFGSAAGGAEYMYFQGDFNNTNTVINSTLTNANGIDAIRVDGTGHPLVGNSYDNDGNPITSQGNSYTPTVAGDLSNGSNAGRTAIISNSINLTGVTLAAGQTLVPDGGILSGTGINLNGSFINNDFTALFNTSTTFSSVYTLSRLSPESFGAVSGDATDDNDAIDALINQSQYAIGTLNGNYRKEQPSNYTRSGTFDWDMNGATVETTNSSNFAINSFDTDYLFNMINLAPRIYNGEFDGNGDVGYAAGGRLFWLRGQPSWYFADLYIHDYHATSNARGMAFRINAYPQRDGFTLGEFYRNTIDEIESDSDGIFNNVNGLSKGVWLSLYEDGTANVYFEGNTITNIRGDDGEAVYVDPQGASKVNNVHFYFENETYKYAVRRQIKTTVSNVHINNCYFEAPTYTQQFNGQAVTMLGIFSTSAANLINIDVTNNQFVNTGPNQMSGMVVTEIDGGIITGNTFTYGSVINYNGLGFGSGDSSYDGVIRNMTVNNNTFVNAGIDFYSNFDVQNGSLIIENNNFTYNNNSINPGAYVGVLRYSRYGGGLVNEPVIFRNNSITYSISGSYGLFLGVLAAQFNSIGNLTLDNVNINYTTGTPGATF